MHEPDRVACSECGVLPGGGVLGVALRGGLPGRGVRAGGAAAGPQPALAHLRRGCSRAPLPRRPRLTQVKYLLRYIKLTKKYFAYVFTHVTKIGTVEHKQNDVMTNFVNSCV